MKKTLTLLTILFVSITGFCQESFDKIIDLSTHTRSYDIIEDNNGNFYLACQKFKAYGNTKHNGIIKKINNEGNIIASKEFDQYYDSSCEKIFIIEDTIYAFVITQQNSTSKKKLTLKKLSTDLNTIETYDYPLGESTRVNILYGFLDKDSNFLISLLCKTYNNDTKQTSTQYNNLKISPQGILVAENINVSTPENPSYTISGIYENDTHYLLFSNILKENKNFYVRTDKENLSSMDTVYLHADIPLNDSTYFRNSLQIDYSKYILLGQCAKNNEILFVKCDSLLNIETTFKPSLPIDTLCYLNSPNMISNKEDAIYSCISVDIDFSAYLEKPTTLEIIKLDKELNQIWRKRYGNGLFYKATKILATNDGGSITISEATDCQNNDYITKIHLLKLDADGNLLWQQELSTPSASIYPNPGREYFEIEETENVNSVELYNMNGVLVLSQKIENNSIRIDTNKLQSGLYIYKVKDDNGKVSYQGKWMRD